MDKHSKQILNCTIKTAYETLLMNLDLKHKRPDLNIKTNKSWIDNLRWTCFDKMNDRNKRIHLRRTQLFFYNNGTQPEPNVVHDFFCQQRILEGWEIGDKRVDYVEENGKKKWIGTDPWLIDFDKLPSGMQEWNISRNMLFARIGQDFLNENDY